MSQATAQAQPTPNALTQALARANKLDLTSLEANRAGRLTSKQVMNMLETLGIVVLILIAIIGLLIAAGIGFPLVSQSNWAGAAVPCVIVIVLFFGIASLFTLLQKIGGDKYVINDISGLPRLFMMVIDMIWGRVKSVEGETTRDLRRVEEQTRDADGNSETRTKYFYSYLVGNNKFNVGEAGYNEFPEHPLNCRIVYLPMSKMLVNIEAL